MRKEEGLGQSIPERTKCNKKETGNIQWRLIELVYLSFPKVSVPCNSCSSCNRLNSQQIITSRQAILCCRQCSIRVEYRKGMRSVVERCDPRDSAGTSLHGTRARRPGGHRRHHRIHSGTTPLPICPHLHSHQTCHHRIHSLIWGTHSLPFLSNLYSTHVYVFGGTCILFVLFLNRQGVPQILPDSYFIQPAYILQTGVLLLKSVKTQLCRP